MAGHRHRSGGVEQGVSGELLEVPVVVALLAVEAHGPGSDPADEMLSLPEVLVRLHDRRAVRAETFDVERAVAADPYRGAEREVVGLGPGHMAGRDPPGRQGH